MVFTHWMNRKANLHGVRGKRFYFPVFTWLVDVAINNAWALHRQVGGDLSDLQFRKAFRPSVSEGGNSVYPQVVQGTPWS